MWYNGGRGAAYRIGRGKAMSNLPLPRHELKDVVRGSVIYLSCNTCERTWNGISKSTCIELMEEHFGHVLIWILWEGPKIVMKDGVDFEGRPKVFYAIHDASGRVVATGIETSASNARSVSLLVARQNGLDINVVFYEKEVV